MVPKLQFNFNEFQVSIHMDQSISIVGIDGNKNCSSGSDESDEDVQSTTSESDTTYQTTDYYETTTEGFNCPSQCMKAYCPSSAVDPISCISEQEPRCFNYATGKQLFSEGTCYDDWNGECLNYSDCLYQKPCSQIYTAYSVCGGFQMAPTG
jgi:hypothetical protein